MQLDKEQLKKKLAEYSADLKSQKDTIEKDVKEYRDSLKEKYKDSVDILEKGKYVALGLGAIFVIYKMLSWIWESPNPEPDAAKEDGPKVIVVNRKESPIVRKIKEAIASFILSIAKKELTRVLEKLRDKDHKKSDGKSHRL